MLVAHTAMWRQVENSKGPSLRPGCLSWSQTLPVHHAPLMRCPHTGHSYPRWPSCRLLVCDAKTEPRGTTGRDLVGRMLVWNLEELDSGHGSPVTG